MFLIRKTPQFSFSFYATCVPVIFIVSLLITFITNNLNPLMLGFCLSLLFTVMYAIRYFGFLSLYSIYLYTSIFFIYSSFIFSLFGGKNFLRISFPKTFTFPESIGILFLIVCFVSVFVMHISYCIFRSKKSFILPNLPTNYNLLKFSKIIMVLFLFPVLVKLLIQFKYIQSHGYLAVYTGELNDIAYPFWTEGAMIFFLAGYCVFLAANPNKKEYGIYSILFLLVSFADSLKGGRSAFIGLILFCLYYYSSHYKVVIKFRKILLLLGVMITFIVVLGSIRDSYGEDNKKTDSGTTNIGDMVVELIYGQSITRAVPMLVIQGDLKYHDYPFIFSQFIRPLNAVKFPDIKNQSHEYAKQYNSLGAVTIYNVSPSAYINGMGYGGSFLAEAYDFGGFFGLVLFSILLARFLVFCDCMQFNVKREFIPLLYFIISTVPLLPRSIVFGFLSDWLRIFISYFFLILFMCLPYITAYQKKANRRIL